MTGGKTTLRFARASNMAWLMLLGVVPLYATGESQSVLGREEADGHGFLRNERGRNLGEGSECGVDFAGVRSSEGSGDYCCVEGCGTCGGDGCHDNAMKNNLDKEDCCTGAIEGSGAMCHETEAAPCIIEQSDVAWVAESVSFGLVRCSQVITDDADQGAFDFTSDEGDIRDLVTCYDECTEQEALYFAVWGGADRTVCGCGRMPAFLSATYKPEGVCNTTCPGNSAETCGGESSYELYAPTCSGGVVGVESDDGNVCCPALCGTCGGSRCVGNGDCCPHTAQENEKMCSDYAAPCILDGGEPSDDDRSDDDSSSDNSGDGSDGEPSDDDRSENDSSSDNSGDDSDGESSDDDSSSDGGSDDDSSSDNSGDDSDDVAWAAESVDYGLVRCSQFDDRDDEREETWPSFSFISEAGYIRDLGACYERCAGELYFAVWGDADGTVCGCGSTAWFLTAANKPEGVCKTTCPGNSAETCGGELSYELYAPTCSGGIVGIESDNGNVCCPAACGTCPKPSCIDENGDIDGNGGCCEHTIQRKEGMCSDTNEAPCIFNEEFFETPAPAPFAKSEPREDQFCADDFLGILSEDEDICCHPRLCTTCGPENCGAGVTHCCSLDVYEAGKHCSDEGVEEGPCIMYDATVARTAAPTAAHTP